MTLKIYNSLTKEKEVFTPLNKDEVKVYVCGPTVYDSCHIGHARSVVVFDMIIRYLKAISYKVQYVRNFTDIDDKIIKRAKELSISEKELSTKYIQEFYEDMDSLNVLRADFEPKATEFIQEIINFISVLIQKGFAYHIEGGGVYFSVEKFKEYGKLSGRKLSDMQAGARIEVNDLKKNPFDFVLWKLAKKGEPFWDSPWGCGRPGWHIECSAMSLKLLGETFDIHGGGKDLIFPHHENEIAQSEAATSKPFVRYWIHNGFININQEKMSKSLNNFKTIKDILKEYHPEVLRIFLLSNHYRNPIDFNEQSILDAKTNLDKLYLVFNRPELLNFKPNNENGKFWQDFQNAMDDDFNTAKALSILLEAIRNLNLALDEKKPFEAIANDIIQISNILGIFYDSPQSYFQKQKLKSNLNPDEIESLILQRNEARKQKDFAKADAIRKKLDEMNIIIEDSKTGTTWKVK